jgi:hypothetical protein
MVDNDLGFLMDRMSRQAPDGNAGRLPSTDNASALPRAARREATQIAKYYHRQYESAVRLRRPHALNWIRVLSVMSGIHYFKINSGGTWIPLRKRDERQIRAFVPVLDPYYRWEHGRLSGNQIGCTATPVTGRSADSFYAAQLAQDSMTHWIEETQVQAVDDLANQYLLTYGGYALFARRDPPRQQVWLQAFPYCDLFPIPFDARTWDEMDGIGRATVVSEDWLATQDELYERRNGTKPDRPMAKSSRVVSTRPTWDYAGFSSGLDWGSRYSGAVAVWVWRKPVPGINPYGEHLFMVEDELYAYVSGQDQQGRDLVTPTGDLPLYPVEYLKKPHDWWPYGFCEQLVPMQREINRQVTNVLQSAEINRGFVAYNSDLITADDIQNAANGLIPFRGPGPEDRSKPIEHFPPSNVGRDVGAVLGLMQEFARSSVAYDSDIIFGKQEGRTEGGPATNLLNTNAQAPMQPVMDRKWRAYKRVFADVLDSIRAVWPAQKLIQVVGATNIGRQMMVDVSRLPGSRDVLLSPTPLMSNGRMGVLNLLLTLRSQPVEQGEAPLVSTPELRRSIQMLGLSPPGLDLFDPRERRIMWRVGQLINDGQQPAIPPAGFAGPNDVQQMEDHELAVRLLREVLLDPATQFYSPQVMQALSQELQFHMQRLPGGVPVDNFDDAIEMFDARQTENALEAMENDPNTLAGQFAPFGVQLG